MIKMMAKDAGTESVFSKCVICQPAIRPNKEHACNPRLHHETNKRRNKQTNKKTQKTSFKNNQTASCHLTKQRRCNYESSNPGLVVVCLQECTIFQNVPENPCRFPPEHAPLILTLILIPVQRTCVHQVRFVQFTNMANCLLGSLVSGATRL